MQAPGATTTIEINTDYQNAERFPAWMALSVFSAVCLAAFDSQQSADNRSSAEKWVLSALILSMCFSFFACLAYLAARHLFVAALPEMIFVRTPSQFLHRRCPGGGGPLPIHASCFGLRAPPLLSCLHPSPQC
jgi:hypothetical protein